MCGPFAGPENRNVVCVCRAVRRLTWRFDPCFFGLDPSPSVSATISLPPAQIEERTSDVMVAQNETRQWVVTSDLAWAAQFSEGARLVSGPAVETERCSAVCMRFCPLVPEAHLSFLLQSTSFKSHSPYLSLSRHPFVDVCHNLNTHVKNRAQYLAPCKRLQNHFRETSSSWLPVSPQAVGTTIWKDPEKIKWKKRLMQFRYFNSQFYFFQDVWL